MRQLVTLVAFRGLGKRTPAGEPDVYKYGHVGVSVDGGETIYGFHPARHVIECVGNDGAIIGALERSCALALWGEVADDTHIFVHAWELSRRFSQVRIRRYDYTSLSAERFRKVKTALEQQLANSDTIRPPWYRLPRAKPPFVDMPVRACNNCATWPSTLGLHLLEKTGLVRELLGVMMHKSTQYWTPGP